MKHFLYNTNIEIHKAKYTTVTSKWSKTSFSYPYFKLYYITDGEAKIILQDRCIVLKKGYLYLLPAFMMLESICQDTLSHHYIHFRIKPITFNIYMEYCKPNLVVSNMSNHTASMLFNIIYKNFKDHDLSSRLNTQGALQLLIAPFFKYFNNHDEKLERFSNVIEYIENHITEKITLHTLAEQMQLDSVYFTNLFSKTFHMPPIQYINKRRLELAQLQLINTNKKVKYIANEVGFENEMYFSRLFRSKIGMTPNQYRKAHR